VFPDDPEFPKFIPPKLNPVVVILPIVPDKPATASGIKIN
jgi:hypothetical protein